MGAGAVFPRFWGSSAFPRPRQPPSLRLSVPRGVAPARRSRPAPGVSEKPPAEGDTPAAAPPGKRRAERVGVWGWGEGEWGKERWGGGRGRVPER